jgi:hypothetical protein
MRRAVRILLNAATAVSLVLCAATVAVWCRSLFAQDTLRFVYKGHFCIATSFPHHLNLVVQHNAYGSDAPTELITGAEPLSFSWLFLRIGWGERDPNATEYWLPHWLPFAVFALLPLRWGWEMRRHRRWAECARLGVCPTCGYDLRATPARCPECGAEAASAGVTNGS